MTAYDRLKASLDAVVNALTARVDYLALYPAKVVQDNGDNTLELKPDDARLPGPSRVPMRLGIPGVTVKVNAGTRVLLGFEGGNPGKPVATLWEKDSLREIIITADTKVTVASPAVNLAGEPALDAVVKGTTYRGLEGPAMQALGLALTNVGAALGGGIGTVIALGPAAAGFCVTAAALATALGPSADSAVLSAKVKTQ